MLVTKMIIQNTDTSQGGNLQYRHGTIDLQNYCDSLQGLYILKFTGNINAIKYLMSFKNNKCYIKFNKVNCLPSKIFLVGGVFGGKGGYFPLS